MGNATVTDELGELYRLDARESEPEDEPAGGQDSGDGNEAGGAEPDGMPHPRAGFRMRAHRRMRWLHRRNLWRRGYVPRPHRPQ